MFDRGFDCWELGLDCGYDKLDCCDDILVDDMFLELIVLMKLLIDIVGWWILLARNIMDLLRYYL